MPLFLWEKNQKNVKYGLGDSLPAPQGKGGIFVKRSLFGK
jgi:hypothetical protein